MIINSECDCARPLFVEPWWSRVGIIGFGRFGPVRALVQEDQRSYWALARDALANNNIGLALAAAHQQVTSQLASVSNSGAFAPKWRFGISLWREKFFGARRKKPIFHHLDK